jgi:hypothetical protein
LSQALRTGVPFNASSVTGTTADVRLVASSAVRRALRLHRLTLARRVVVLHPGAPIEGALRLRLFAKRALSHVRRPVPLTVELRVGSRIAAAARVTLSRR